MKPVSAPTRENVEPETSAAAEHNMRCPACQAHRSVRFGCKNQHALWRCLACGTVFINAVTNHRDLSELYEHYYDGARFEIPPVVARSLERLVMSCDSWRQTGRWLDVGYGEGGLLTIAQQHGWQCYGTEISPPALAYGQERGWIVAADAERDARFPTGGFDVVTMIELLEHVPAPDRFLQAAARWLRPGGLLYITTPNARSLNRWVLGLDWSVFAPPEHITIWTARGLIAALTRNGFVPYRLRSEGLNPAEWLARWRRRAGSAVAVNRNQAAFALNEALSRSAARRALKSSINHCLSWMNIGDALKVWARRESPDR
ncbi:MAG: class I SAM-dependent methyltransferase [Acidobacteriota bacterium]|nr:class I SAM-dependent methyltransferase [Blastocatellia bacterium]MDW8240531.1 class I SAM-dependent methyltransferase [Acidobacteriota bacterium]